jgi:hypothetical protein
MAAMNRLIPQYRALLSGLLLALLTLFRTMAQDHPYKPGNPLVPYIGMADPHIYVFNGKPYLYSTRDKDSLKTKGRFIMPDWHIWSTEDLLHWKHERTILPDLHGSFQRLLGNGNGCPKREILPLFFG